MPGDSGLLITGRTGLNLGIELSQRKADWERASIFRFMEHSTSSLTES